MLTTKLPRQFAGVGQITQAWRADTSVHPEAPPAKSACQPFGHDMGELFDKHDRVQHDADQAAKKAAARKQPGTDARLIQIAEYQRDDGIQRSRDSSGEEWHEYALEFVRRYLERHRTLHVDQLWRAGLQEPNSPRALGAVMQAAAKRNWITAIRAHGGTVARPSTRSNMQLKPIWRSELYREIR